MKKIRMPLISLIVLCTVMPSTLTANQDTAAHAMAVESGLPDSTSSDIDHHQPINTVKKSKKRKKGRKKSTIGPAFCEIVRDVFWDVVILNRNLFLWDTFKVVTTLFPIFIATRMIDEPLQNCFYDGQNHKNVNQLPHWCHTVAKTSIAIPIVWLGSDAIFSKDNDRRWTGQILLLGMPFVIWTKSLVKKIKFDACLRPWNENFSCKERSSGGFPSGHMAQAAYMAVLYGVRYGPRYAIPLGILATGLGAVFISCNRHYTSQLVAGVGFGAIYALAADKLVTAKMTQNVKLGFQVDDIGRAKLSLAVNF